MRPRILKSYIRTPGVRCFDSRLPVLGNQRTSAHSPATSATDAQRITAALPHANMVEEPASVKTHLWVFFVASVGCWSWQILGPFVGGLSTLIGGPCVVLMLIIGILFAPVRWNYPEAVDNLGKNYWFRWYAARAAPRALTRKEGGRETLRTPGQSHSQASPRSSLMTLLAAQALLPRRLQPLHQGRSRSDRQAQQLV